MGSPAKVTSIEDGRAIAEDRTLYRTAQGRQKEPYLGLPCFSLLPRIFELPLAEVRMLVYVWMRTGGWKEYHINPQPTRITFAEWLSGRPNYPKDTGTHLCKQEITTTREALVARGLLYEEWETPHERGPRRYALIAPQNPGIGPYQREDGSWEVLLLTDEGAKPYQIPEVVLRYRTEGMAVLQHRKGAVLEHRKDCPTKQDSPVLQHRKEKSRRAFPGQVAVQPITNSLANSSINRDLANGLAETSPPSEHQPKGIKIKKGTGSSSQQQISREKPKKPPNPLYAVWCTHAPRPATKGEGIRWNIGLRELLEAEPPVTPDELPRLIALYKTLQDKNGQPYALNPQALSNNLTRLRELVIYTWVPIEPTDGDENAPAAASAELARIDVVEEPINLDGGEEAAIEGRIDDPAWITQLSRFVPDAEGMRDDRKTRDVHVLWGFVRDALYPGLNTARRQHLDSLVPAWHPANPRELVLLGSTSYTIRFANMAMRREINDLIEKLLSRFFDHARLVFVSHEVIDRVQEQRQESVSQK